MNNSVIVLTLQFILVLDCFLSNPLITCRLWIAAFLLSVAAIGLICTPSKFFSPPKYFLINDLGEKLMAATAPVKPAMPQIIYF